MPLTMPYFSSIGSLHQSSKTNRHIFPYLKKTDLNSFKVSGCLEYASTLQSHGTKVYARARKISFLGIHGMLQRICSSWLEIPKNIYIYKCFIPRAYFTFPFNSNNNYEIYPNHVAPPITVQLSEPHKMKPLNIMQILLHTFLSSSNHHPFICTIIP